MILQKVREVLFSKPKCKVYRVGFDTEETLLIISDISCVRLKNKKTEEPYVEVLLKNGKMLAFGWESKKDTLKLFSDLTQILAS